jgi:hypothetical protein
LCTFSVPTATAVWNLNPKLPCPPSRQRLF